MDATDLPSTVSWTMPEDSTHVSIVPHWTRTEEDTNTTSILVSCPMEPKHISIAIVLCMILLLGLLLNIFSVWVFMCRMPKWKPGTILQFHLAVSDAAICPLAPFIMVYFAKGGNWPFGNFMCRLKIALLTTHFYGSILFLTLISVYRYVSVVYHRQDSRLKQKDFVKKLCAGVWLFVLVKGAVCAALIGESTVGNQTVCLNIHQTNNINVYFAMNLIFFIPGFLVPFSISLYCYIRLARSVSTINICHQKGKRIKSKSYKMVAICLVIFGLCFLPMNVVRTVVVVVKKYFSGNCDLLSKVETAYYVSWVLSSANCCLDPLIYCFSSENFTKAVRSSLRKIGVRIQTPQEDSAGRGQQENNVVAHYPTWDITDERT
ncbi:lysophosphatidic acid receptor 6-like [Astyanax mexicanus]|uniref:lysophosphatidic acid receptor 6-like n=1 Tax=Astyanax mexicanus TaxID=7994 RepID=UPI0020CB5FD1|nr:lysophosphatidic acid receptor 6-like [Astyanax mexicanus]